MDKRIPERELSQTERLESIENSLSDARAKLKSEISRRQAYLIIGCIATLILLLHLGQVISLPVWLIVLMGLIAVGFLFPSLGVDVEKPRAEVEKLESTKRLYLDVIPQLREENVRLATMEQSFPSKGKPDIIWRRLSSLLHSA